jgi:hypothetical protein
MRQHYIGECYQATVAVEEPRARRGHCSSPREGVLPSHSRGEVHHCMVHGEVTVVDNEDEGWNMAFGCDSLSCVWGSEGGLRWYY